MTGYIARADRAGRRLRQGAIDARGGGDRGERRGLEKRACVADDEASGCNTAMSGAIVCGRMFWFSSASHFHQFCRVLLLHNLSAILLHFVLQCVLFSIMFFYVFLNGLGAVSHTFSNFMLEDAVHCQTML